MKSIFGTGESIGSAQFRSKGTSGLALTGIQRVSSAAGTYATEIPTLRSDRSAAAGEQIVLPGVAKTNGVVHTSIYLQETGAGTATVQIDFLAKSDVIRPALEEWESGSFWLRLDTGWRHMRSLPSVASSTTF